MKSLDRNQEKFKHVSKKAGKGEKTNLDFNDSILSSDDVITSPVRLPFIESTNPQQLHQFLEHAGELQQLSEMDANLQQHIAQGGILHLATLTNTETETDDNVSYHESSIIESSLYANLSYEKLKDMMRPVGDIQLKPPLLSILSQEVATPSWDPQTLDTIPSPPLHLELPNVKDDQKIDLLSEVVYGCNFLRSMRVKRIVERCISLSKDKPFFSFDLLFLVISQMTTDKAWLLSLVEACSLRLNAETSGIRRNEISASSVSLSEVHLDNLWRIISLQLDTSPCSYSPREKSFLLSFSLLLTVDKSVDTCHTDISSFTSSLFDTADLGILRTVLRAVLDRVAHHHTLLRLCSSVRNWNGNATAFQAWIALRALSHSLRDDCHQGQEEQISTLEDIYRLVPGRILELLESYLSDRNMDQHCDFYQLYSELHMLFILLTSSLVSSWSADQFQFLRDNLQLLSQMFRKYSLNLDGIKIKECIRHLIKRVDIDSS